MRLVHVPPGEFVMGWEDGFPAERPAHSVWLDAFLIADAPVTNADFSPYLGETGAAPPRYWGVSGFDDGAQPVVGLSWAEASAFAEWIGGRLPTEAEWEKAARGGLRGRRFPWGDEAPAAARRFDRPPSVGETPPNPLGLMDLSGVCHEWCADWYGEDYYARSPTCNPRGPEGGTRRASRGGAWRHADPWSAVAHRSSLPPDLRYSDYGVRVAAGLESPLARQGRDPALP